MTPQRVRLRPGSRWAAWLFIFLAGTSARGVAQTTMSPQRVFDTGHNLGAFFGDLRWEWLALGNNYFIGPTRANYPIWSSQLITTWPAAWGGVMVRSTDVGLVGGRPTAVTQVHDNIEADLRDFSCPSLNPPDLATHLYRAGLFMANAFYYAGRGGGACMVCLRELLATAGIHLGRAAAQFPALGEVARKINVMTDRGWRSEQLQALFTEVSDILPDGPIPCDAPMTPAPPPQPTPPGTFTLYNTPYDPQQAAAFGMQVRADSRGGEMSGRYAMDGRCLDQVRITWQFDRDVTTIAPGQRIGVQYAIATQGNCRPAAREYLIFEARGFVFAGAVPPPIATASIGADRLRTCGVLSVRAADNASAAWGGGANRRTSNRQTYTTDPRVIAPERPCAWALLSFTLTDRRTGRTLDLVYHYER